MIVVLDDHGFIIMGWEVEGGLRKRSMEVKKEIMGCLEEAKQGN
jgi:hypothetical protein